MRTITDHKLTGLNEAIEIFAQDQPGPGGANHDYMIVVSTTNPTGAISQNGVPIRFQKGLIKEVGVNGLSNEALLAILIDRLRGFQFTRTIDDEFRVDISGPFSSRENAIVLLHLEDAMHWLQARTRARLARGVEGTSQK